VADDQRDVLESLRLLLKSEGYSAETFANPEGLVSALRERTADAVLMDLNYTRDTTSGDEGLDTVTRIRSFDAHTPIVLMTAWGTINLAVEGMRRGAQDFIEKPWDNERLLTVLRTQVALGRALQRARQLEAENLSLKASGSGELLIAESAAMQPVLETIERVAPTDANVLITGESGCGKGLVARLIHDGSPRRERRHRQSRRDRLRERDVRPRQGRVHGREKRPRRSLRARRRRHAVLGRDREHPRRAAGQVAARARGRPVRATGLVADAARRRARARRD
jgi:DNA-binding NtrC family response regulator